MRKIVIVNYNKEKHKEFINEAFRDDDVKRYFNNKGYRDVNNWSLDAYDIVLFAEVAGKPSGFIKASFQPLNGRCYVDYIYVEGSYRGKGLSKELLEACEKKAFEYYPTTGMYMLTIENIIMEKMLVSRGYNINGIYKNFTFRDGKYHNQTLFIKNFKKCL